MLRFRRLLVGAGWPGGVFLVLAAVAASPLAVGQRGASDAEVHPAAVLEGHLSDQRGRVVVMHFWASWCLPCREEAHSLARFRETVYPRLSARGLRVLTVNNDLRRGDLDRFMADHPVVFPVYFDPYGHWFDRYGLTGLPGTVVLGPDGAVIDEMVGAHEWTDPDYLARLRGYLADAEMASGYGQP